jgi:ZIP family zinc transporter
LEECFQVRTKALPEVSRKDTAVAWQAALYALVAASTLVVGALIGLYVKVGRRTIAVIMAFGAGVLISTLAFELMEEAYNTGGFDSTTIGFISGAILFILVDWAVNRKGGHLRKDTLNKRHLAHKPQDEQGSGLAIFIGALIDGIPESIAIGIGLLAGKGVSAVMVLAVLLSNLPEGISGAVSMTRAGWAKRSVVLMWTGVVIASSLSSLFGYVFLKHASVDLIAFFLSLAAGGILAMVSSTMIPEAFDDEGRLTPIATPFATVIGFLLAFVLSAVRK